MKNAINRIMSFLPVLVIGAVLFMGCEDITSVDETSSLNHEAIGAEMAKSGQWAEKVSGGGKNVGEDGITEWVSLHATKDADGNVSGMFEYANTGIQDWRYHGSAECLAVSPDGSQAVVIGSVTLTQGPDSPALGTLVAFFINDNGNGNNQDSAVTFFAGGLNCDDLINNVPNGRPTSGNYNIAVR